MEISPWNLTKGFVSAREGKGTLKLSGNLSMTCSIGVMSCHGPIQACIGTGRIVRMIDQRGCGWWMMDDDYFCYHTRK